MMQFADQFTEKEIVVTLSRQLSWSHFLAILPIKNIEAKIFYANQVIEPEILVSKASEMKLKLSDQEEFIFPNGKSLKTLHFIQR